MTPVQKTLGAAACAFALVGSMPAVPGTMLYAAAKSEGAHLPLKDAMSYSYGLACISLGICSLKKAPN